MNGERWTLAGLHCDPPPPECEFVLASDYDALAAELGDIKSSWTFTELPAAYDRMTDAERKAQARIAQLEAALLSLLPGLELDLRWADADDDTDAMRSRIETVRECFPSTSTGEPNVDR